MMESIDLVKRPVSLGRKLGALPVEDEDESWRRIIGLANAADVLGRGLDHVQKRLCFMGQDAPYTRFKGRPVSS